jgi:SAM-dependent methyltransferase
MTEEYDEATARHYAAYRPPLHERILRPVLVRLPRFAKALDIGCGAGYSTVALTPFAGELVGTDASRHMTRVATERCPPGPIFVSAAPHSFSRAFQHERFDLFTLGGSLSYLDPEETLDGIFSLVEWKAWVVVYDFDVDLGGVYGQLGYQPAPSGYRHDVELPERERLDFTRRLKVRNQLSFTASSPELAHLLLSVKAFRLWAEKEFGDEATHTRLAKVLGVEVHKLTATTWCSLFAFQR